jgi:beta-galactosidase
MYLPGVWLNQGKNEIIILDVDHPSKNIIAGLMKPVLDKISPDESFLHRVKGQALNLTGEAPAYTGTFTNGAGWKEVSLPGAVEGRYICIEALNAQDQKDLLAAIAEIELLNTNGSALSSLAWKIIYADSEEVTAGNHSADKIYDQQESTFWQSQAIGAKPGYPHQVILDLGKVETVKGFRYLPRSDKKTDGMIKDYRLFVSKKPFRF